MKNVQATLRSLRYFDSLVIRGKRVLMGPDYQDPCNHWGHEGVLGFVTLYCNDSTVREDAYLWSAADIKHLGHIVECSYCMARVFSLPDERLAHQGRVLLRAMS